MEDLNRNLCAISSLIYAKRGACKKIRDELGCPLSLFDLKPSEIDTLTGSEGDGEKLKSKEYLSVAQQEADWCKSKGVEIIEINSPKYPPLLRECDDAPLILYFKGNGDLTKRKSVAIVGTRVPSDYGIKECGNVVEALASSNHNPLIISGLAVGIDINAHRNALNKSLETIAVLPCGIDNIYPATNREYAIKMLTQGGVITEFPRGVKPLRFNFLQRNRIIAGMAAAIVVVESRISGGSMSTVEYGWSYGREIVALPGRVNDVNSYGCNYLISKNIASIYLNSSTIPKVLNWGDESSDIALSPDLFSTDERVKEKILLTLASIKRGSIEQIVEISGLDADIVSAAMIELELSFKVKKDSKDLFELYLR